MLKKDENKEEGFLSKEIFENNVSIIDTKEFVVDSITSPLIGCEIGQRAVQKHFNLVDLPVKSKNGFKLFYTLWKVSVTITKTNNETCFAIFMFHGTSSGYSGELPTKVYFKHNTGVHDIWDIGRIYCSASDKDTVYHWRKNFNPDLFDLTNGIEYWCEPSYWHLPDDD